MWRLEQAQGDGLQRLRTSHNPPTPEAAGRLRPAGHAGHGREPPLRHHARRTWRSSTGLVRRDRNHPSVILWSIGNEEMRLQGTRGLQHGPPNDAGARQQADATRPVTAAMNGGWDTRASVSQTCRRAWDSTTSTRLKRPDSITRPTPRQPCIGTEEASTVHHARRVRDRPKRPCHRAPTTTKRPSGASTAERGGSYRQPARSWPGRSSGPASTTAANRRPYNWPTISSQFGIMDTCGFPKDSFYYHQSQWCRTSPCCISCRTGTGPARKASRSSVLALQQLRRRRAVPERPQPGQQKVDHARRAPGMGCPYAPGRLMLRGYRGAAGRVSAVETTGAPVRVSLTPDRPRSGPTARTSAGDGRRRRRAGPRRAHRRHAVHFESRAATIIGVGNGDPNSHEPDKARAQGLQRPGAGDRAV